METLEVVTAAVGFALIVGGLALLSVPVAIIVAGILIAAAAIL